MPYYFSMEYYCQFAAWGQKATVTGFLYFYHDSASANLCANWQFHFCIVIFWDACFVCIHNFTEQKLTFQKNNNFFQISAAY